MTDFVVVGGGVAGLVAARSLASGGASVTLLEASDHLGGTVTHQTVGGLIVDAGAESFATRRGTVAALAAQLGLGNEIVTPEPAGAWMQRPEGAVPLPATSLLGIPAIPLAEDVIAVVGAKAAFRAYLDAVMPAAIGAKSRTLGELVRTRMGADMLEKLVTPVAGGVHSAHPDELDLDRVAPGLRAALQRERSLARAVLRLRETAPSGSAVAGIRGGINRLVGELAVDLERFRVDVRLGQRVDRVTAGSVVTATETIGGTVVVAAPGVPGAAHPLPGAGDGTRVVLATLVLESAELDAAPRGSGVLVAAGVDGIRARALTHSTAKWKWLAERAGGKHVVRLSYDPTKYDPASVAELAETARTDAAALLGVALEPSSVLDFARVGWTRPPAQGEALEGITLIGEATSGTGLASVVAQAQSTATQLLTERAGDPDADD